MGPSPHADDPRPRSARPPAHEPGERPTLFAPPPPPSPPAQGQPARISPSPVPKRRLTVRQLLVGQRSIVFVGIMLARMIWLLVQGVRTGSDLRFAAAGAGIYMMALLIASPGRRLRAGAVGMMCGLIWSYAFVDPSQLGSPALRSWPAVFPIGVLAVLVEIIFTDVIRARRGKYGGRDGVLAAGLPRAALGLQAFGVVLFILPVVVMSVEGVLAFGLESEPLTDLVIVSISLPPLIGMIVYVSYVLRRLRGLAPRPARS